MYALYNFRLSLIDEFCLFRTNAASEQYLISYIDCYVGVIVMDCYLHEFCMERGAELSFFLV
jgi:hypothetical protein